MNRRKFLNYIGCGCCGVVFNGCSTAPITDRRQFKIIPEAKLNAQAAAIYEKIKKKEKMSDDKVTLKLIQNIGKKMNINTVANHGIDWKQPSSFKKELIKNIPKGRMMKTKDLYGIIDYLCSKNNTFMNGSTIVLDGGYSSW